MLEDSLITTLEQSLVQTRNALSRLTSRLLAAEADVEMLRLEIRALEDSANHTEKAIGQLLLERRKSNRQAVGDTRNSADEEFELRLVKREGGSVVEDRRFGMPRHESPVSYLHQSRSIPSIRSNFEPVSNRFNDRTITQSCTLLLREAGRPLHVNELYNLLIAGGMKFKGNNPTISVAVSLSRNQRFRKVDPGTFDLVMREALQVAS
jgi:hypothetical protein